MKARVLHISGTQFLVGKGRHIFISKDSGKHWEVLFSVKTNIFLRIVMKSAILMRLFRLGFHHCLVCDEQTAVCIFNKSILWFDLQTGNCLKQDRLVGSRPLTLLENEGNILYGEYRTNVERSPVHIWSANILDKDWSPVFTFDDVRHIHGIFFDSFEGEYWITTGDTDEESYVTICSTNFLHSRVILKGSQQTRIVQPVFTKEAIYFASDAPQETNYIYRFMRKHEVLQKVQKIGGPVFFGQLVGESIFFSTVVEPSDTELGDVVELWHSYRGNSWKCVKQFQKDILSKRYFQYGQLLYPTTSDSTTHLHISLSATVSHGEYLSLPIDVLRLNGHKTQETNQYSNKGK